MYLLRRFFLISGIFCICVSVILTIVYTFTTGITLAVIAGISFLILYSIYPRLTNRVQKMIIYLMLVLVIYVVSMISIIGKQSTKNTATFTEDCVLVLGSALKKDKPLPTLQYRLDKCIEYLQRNPKALIIVSGGKGSGEAICESEAMKRYLVTKGVNAGQIFEENQSKNTRQNMIFSKIKFDSLFPSGEYYVVCITSGFHVYRASYLSKKANLPVSHYNAKTIWYIYPTAYIRESFSVIKMWLGL